MKMGAVLGWLSFNDFKDWVTIYDSSIEILTMTLIYKVRPTIQDQRGQGQRRNFRSGSGRGLSVP